MTAAGAPLLGGKVGHRRGGQDTGIDHVDALAGQPGRERGLQQRARAAGVPPDDEPPVAASGLGHPGVPGPSVAAGGPTKDPRRGPAEGQHVLGGQLGVRPGPLRRQCQSAAFILCETFCPGTGAVNAGC